MLYLRLLGGVSLHSESGALPGTVTQRRRLALLALLAAHGRRPVSRDKLIAYLWPEVEAERGRHLLADAVYKLRRTLGRDVILATGDDLLLNAEAIRGDLAEFEDAVARGDHARAVRLYEGPFLDGVFVKDAPAFERWVEDARARLSGFYRRALQALAEEREAVGDATGAAEAWSLALTADPYDSRIVLRLMRSLDAAGDRARALHYARAHADLLRDELSAEPDPEVVALAESLRRASLERRVVEGDQEARPADSEADGRLVRSGAAAPARGPGPATTGWAALLALVRQRPRAALLAAAGVAAAALAVVGLVRALPGGILGTRAPAPIRAIAVLPFENLSPSDEQEYFADGMTDALITDLARLGQVRVISRTSVMPYKSTRGSLAEIGRRLNVDAVVEGTVMRAGDRVRLTAQLVQVATDEHLWADRYDRELRDVLALQDELARAIARQISGRLPPPREPRPSPPPVDPVAYELYLKGRYAWNRRTEEGLHRAIEFFRQAIERDPDYAPAHAGLGDAYLILAAGYARVPPNELYARAKAAVQRGLELDPTLAEAHASLGFIRGLYDWEWTDAEREFQRAIELNPSYATAYQWYALLLGGLGRVDEAIARLHEAESLDPLSPAIGTDVGRVLYYERRHDEALDELRKTLALDPTFARAHGVLAAVDLQAGRIHDAIAGHERAIELAGGWLQQRWGLPGLGYAYAVAGNERKAREILGVLERERAERYERPESLALVHAGLGEHHRALEWLERAADERSIYPLLIRDVVYDPIREHPRFQRILERMNLQ